MVRITNDEEFKNACAILIERGELPVTGSRFINAAERIVIDEATGTDITPSQAILESALDSHNTMIAEQTTRDTNNRASRNLAKALRNSDDELHDTDTKFRTLHTAIRTQPSSYQTILYTALEAETGLTQVAMDGTPTATQKAQFIASIRAIVNTWG